MNLQFVILTIFMSLTLANCSKGGSGGGSEGGEVTTAGTTAGGVSSTGGGYKTGTTGQLVVDKGSPTATEVNAQQLNLPAGIKPAGPAVNVNDSKDYNAGQIVIAIPYEREKNSGLWAALTDEDTSRLVVIYHVKNPDGTYTLGLVPNPELEFEEDLVSFTSRGPGNYQAAYLPEPVIKPIAKTVDAPVLSVEEESALPAVTWASLTGESTAARKFKISGSISNTDVILKRCVVIIDEDKDYPYDQAIYVAGSLSTEHVIAKETAHDLYGRLECQDNYGRSVTSSWTDKVSVPAAKYAAVSLQLAASGVASDSFIKSGEEASSDEWLTSSFSDHVEVKYTSWLSAPINYTCASSLNYNLSAHPSITDLPGEGVYWVCAKVTSVHSKVSYEHTPQLTKDTVAPTVNAGADIITNGIANINATVVGADVIAWSKNSGPGTVTFGTPSAEDTTATMSSDGVYVMLLTVSDMAGNAASDTVQITKDATPPVLSFVSSAEADGMVNIADKALGGNNELFGVSVTDAIETKFSTWVTSATTCNVSVTYSQPSVPKYSSIVSDFGSMKICARAKDAANNISYASSAAISADLSAPTVALSNITPAAGITNINTLSFDVTPAISYEYSFVDQSTACASVVSWTAGSGMTGSPILADGPNRLCVRGVEPSGNASAIVEHDWSIDASAPIAGNNGKIVINDLYFAGGQGIMEYSWDAATDNATPQAGLQYEVFISTDGGLDANSVSGATFLTSQLGGSGLISKSQSTLLTDNGVLQYLYVRVTDALGNKAIYDRRSFRVPEASNQAFSQITLGANTACGLDQEGYAYCWGGNGTSGQLGNGTTGGTQYVPQKVNAGIKRFRKISSGTNHSCALDEIGNAYCWGNNISGQLGDGGALSQPSPVLVNHGAIGGIKFRDIVAASAFTCAIGLNGSAYCWGDNSFGQLGDNSSIGRNVPAIVLIEGGGTAKFNSIHSSAGQYSVCAISDDGIAYCWGDNYEGQIADAGDPIQKATPLSAGDKFTSVALGTGAACYLSSKGTVWCRGYNGELQLGRNDAIANSTTLALVQKQDTNPLDKIVSISGGNSGFCAQNDEGALHCWGSNAGTNGIMLDVDMGEYGYARPFSISGGATTQLVTNGNTSCALNGEGDAYCWGANSSKQTGADVGNPAPQTQLNFSSLRAITRFASIATGANHSCAITGQGKAHCWGDRANGKIGDGGGMTGVDFEAVAVNAGATRFKQIAVGAQHSCAVTDAGEVACWGDNAYGQLGSGGGDSSSPAVVPSEKFVQIALGEFHSCGLTAAGSVKCWGSNSTGQLGIGSYTPSVSSSPLSVTGAGTYVAVAAGKNHSCAIHEDGQVSCWGDNTHYQLAKPSPSSSPVVIDGAHRFSKLALGANHACALRADSIPMCWGDNTASQVGNGASGSAIQAPYAVYGGAVADVAAGGSHSCVVAANSQSPYCWGGNSLGQLGIGSYTDIPSIAGATNMNHAVRSISLGGNGSCAVLLNGSSYCWGDDNLGQLGDMLSNAMQNSPSRVSEFYVP